MSNKGPVLIVGGLGRLGPQYREAVEAVGRKPIIVEKGTLRQDVSVGLVVVLVPKVSHGLREAAQSLAARKKAPIVYLRSTSLSAVRKALADAQSEPTRRESA